MTPKLDQKTALEFEAAVHKYLLLGHKPPGAKINAKIGETGALTMACKDLGVPRGGRLSRLAAVKRVLLREPNWSLYRPAGSEAEGTPPTPHPVEPPVPGTPAAVEPPQNDRHVQRLRDDLKRTQRELRDAHRELNSGEDLRSAVFGLAERDPEPPDWRVRSGEGASGGEIPILFTSDFQWGEVVFPDQIEGLNEYSSVIAARRYRTLIESTIDICFEHSAAPDYPGMIYLRGGDTISGDIHQELRETNDLSSIPAIMDVVEKEIWGIGALADRFGKVEVISVPGNHGRQTHKPVAKQYASTNYDHLIAWTIQKWFESRGDTRITFRTPVSGDAFFDVLGWRCLLTHGDRIGSRGGTGFIGPAATIMRGMKKVMDQQARIGRHIDFLFTCHFHTPMELTYGFANGALAGYTEYAQTLRATPEAPSQWLLFVHKERGITTRRKIFVEDPRLRAYAAARLDFGATEEDEA